MGALPLEYVAERIVGRYAIYDEIASGGMAVVHVGRLLGQGGFARTVAIKRLHPQYGKDPGFVSMFLDEARLAVRVQHPNVVAPLDVVIVNEELFLVMEYVAGETLARLVRSSWESIDGVEPSVIASVMIGALYGLHAAHEAVSEQGTPLNIVHRDISPQNIMVGLDGTARVLDFGVAKAAMRSQSTTGGEIKGKVAYMAPEQVKNVHIDRRTDVFAAGIVYWEALTGRRLFQTEDLGATLIAVLQAEVKPPSHFNAKVTKDIDAVVMRALQRDPADRFQSAREYAMAIERAAVPATPGQVGDWVRKAGGPKLARRAERVAAIENHSCSMPRACPVPAVPPPPAHPSHTHVKLSAPQIPPPPAPPGRLRPSGQRAVGSGAPIPIHPTSTPAAGSSLFPIESGRSGPPTMVLPESDELARKRDASVGLPRIESDPREADGERRAERTDSSPQDFYDAGPEEGSLVLRARDSSVERRSRGKTRLIAAAVGGVITMGSVLWLALGHTRDSAGSPARKPDRGAQSGRSVAVEGVVASGSAAVGTAVVEGPASQGTAAVGTAAVGTATVSTAAVGTIALGARSSREKYAVPAGTILEVIGDKREPVASSTASEAAPASSGVAPGQPVGSPQRVVSANQPSRGAGPGAVPAPALSKSGAGPASLKPKTASCSPPYYLDARGIRRLRPECL